MSKEKERIILRLLSDGSELFSPQMIKDSNKKLGRWAIHVLLGDMEDRGLIEGREVPDTETGVNRRLYRITPAGLEIIRK